MAKCSLTPYSGNRNIRPQKVIVALPNFPVFTNLIGRTRHALEKLDIGVFRVRYTCTVERLL